MIVQGSSAKNNLDFEKFLILFKHLSDNFANALGYKLVNDMAQFYLNYIVDSNDYCCEMNKLTCLELINIFTVSYLNSVCSIASLDQMTCAKCISKLLTKCYKYIGFFNGSKLLAFFNISIPNIK